MTSSRHHPLARAAGAITVVTSLLFGPLRATEAQTRSTEPALDEQERASIEREAGVASFLYVVSAISLGVSAVLELTAVFMVLDGSPEPLLGPDLGGLKTFELLGAVGGVIGGIGIIALPLAIGLDVDSHSRRDALERRGCPRLSFTPGGLMLSGSF